MGEEGELGDGRRIDEGHEMGQGPGRRDDDSGSTSESEDDLSERSGEDEEEEDEEEESDEDESLDSVSVDWVEVRESTEYAIEGFTPGFVGVNHTLDTTASPLSFFNLIFDDALFESFVIETNRYAHQSLAADAAKAARAVAAPTAAAGSDADEVADRADRAVDENWTDTNVPEIKAYIGINVAFGLRGHTSIDEIWNANPLLNDPVLSRVMSRNRYRALSKYFHIVDNTGAPAYRQEGYDPMHKVRPIIDFFNIRCADLYKPKQHLSVDEAMIPFKGRHFAKQYMPKKPDKFGFKVWVCAEADTGYALQVEVYVGKAGDPDRARLRSEHGTGYDIVTQLTKRYWEKYHVITYDRFFSSVPLAENLMQHKTYVNSTVMLNRRGLPPAAKKLKLKKSNPCHQYLKGNLLLTVFHDKRQISHLSTGCLPGLSDNGVKPLVNVAYNKHMGGVDLCDQHMSYYPVGRKTVKWWKYIFWRFISLAIYNAYVLYKASPTPIATDDGSHPTALVTHKTFRLAIIEQLLGNLCSRRAPVKRLRPSSDALLMDLADAITHTAELSQKLRICRYCHMKGGKKRSRTWCKDCDVNLCPYGCFQRYHAERCGISTD